MHVCVRLLFGRIAAGAKLNVAPPSVKYAAGGRAAAAAAAVAVLLLCAGHQRCVYLVSPVTPI